MKRITLLFILLSITFSCKTVDLSKDLESIQFYDFNGSTISLHEIKQQWNKRLQDDEEINTQITKLAIRKVTDRKTEEKKFMLIGYTEDNSTKTATEVVRFKDGAKLSNRTVTCKNCNENLAPKLYDGYWVCTKKDKKYHSCTKISTLVTN